MYERRWRQNESTQLFRTKSYIRVKNLKEHIGSYSGCLFPLLDLVQS